MCALLQKVRIQLFFHTYLLRFRPSNIKMLSTRLVMSPPPCLCFLSVWMAVKCGIFGVRDAGVCFDSCIATTSGGVVHMRCLSSSTVLLMPFALI